MPPADQTAAWNFETDTTLVRVLARNAEAFPDKVAMREKSKGIWQETTWRELLEMVLRCAAGLEALGFKTGEVMLVLGDNRPRLYAGMLATGALGGFAMPAYPDATLEELQAWLADDRKVKVSIGCLWNRLKFLELTLKKSQNVPPSRIGRTSLRRAMNGGRARGH